MTIGLPAITRSEARMPRPSDVPPCELSRSIAVLTATWSSVGGWTTSDPSLNATTPILID